MLQKASRRTSLSECSSNDLSEMLLRSQWPLENCTLNEDMLSVVNESYNPSLCAAATSVPTRKKSASLFRRACKATRNLAYT